MPNPAAKQPPHISIRFVYSFCLDVETMRHFYTELVGMQQCAFNDDANWGWVCYQSEGFQLMFLRVDEGLKPTKEWAAQPGWEGGKLFSISWSVNIPTIEEFTSIYRRLQKSEIKLFNPVPDWRQDSYWGISVLDPMGNTVEIYSVPTEKPQTTIWQD